MSHDSDTAETYRAMNERTRAIKASRKESNMKYLEEMGVTGYTPHQDNTILVFGNGVRFFPSTSKWSAGTKTMYGGAKQFLAWYNSRLKRGR